MRIVWLLLLLSVVLVPLDRSYAQATAITPTDCLTSVSFDERPVDCGTIEVPLDHDNPNNGVAVLPIMIVRAQDTPDAQNNAPLYLLQGGPGGDTIDTFAFLTAKIDTVLPTNRDIVFYEQRGTTNAKPSLDCPEVHTLGITLLDEDISYEEGVDKYIVAYGQCIERLRNAGVDLQLFNSRQNALDTIYIADKLGHDQIDLYGVSYGSLLAQHVTRLNPSLIRSLVIDGIVPPNESVDARVYQSRHDALEAIFRDCENDSSCASAYPTLRQQYANVMTDYQTNPRMWKLSDPSDAAVTHTARVDNYVLQGWIFSWMYDDQIVRYIPLMIHQLANNHTDQVRVFASFIVFNDSMAEMMYMSTTCSEETQVAIDDYVIPANNLLPLMDGELINDQRYRRALCTASQVTPLSADYNAEFRTDVPTLIVSGRYDPITPAVFGDIVARSVPQATHIVIPNSAHGAMLSSACAADIATAFWTNPTAPLDTSCVASQRTQFAHPDDLIITSFTAQTAQLSDNSITIWLVIIATVVMLLFGFMGRIARWLLGIIRRQSVQSTGIRWYKRIQFSVILGGLFVISYIMWQLVGLVITSDYALFFGIPDPQMILRISIWCFVGLTVINLISTLRTYAQQRFAWYSTLFASMIVLGSVGLSIALVISGIY